MDLLVDIGVVRAVAKPKKVSVRNGLDVKLPHCVICWVDQGRPNSVSLDLSTDVSQHKMTG